MEVTFKKDKPSQVLSAQELLAGSATIHEVEIPEDLLHPGSEASQATAGSVRMRSITVGTLAVISRASREDPSLAPLLMIKEALVEPTPSLDQLRKMHVGLAHFLLGEIYQISGLGLDGEAYDKALESPNTKAQVLLARHFGWTPDQVAQLTPAQVMVYLAGIEKLLALEEHRRKQAEP